MKKIFKTLIVLALVSAVLSPAFAGGKKESPIVWVWNPNESTPERAASRDELAKIVSEAVGREVEIQLTTDYSVVIEAMVHGNAAISWLGGEGYVRSNSREPAVKALTVHTDKSGKLDNAKYYAMLGVKKAVAGDYTINGKYDLGTLKQKRFSFVSNSSTSGFVVPSSIISKHFNVKPEDLLEGGSNKVFSDVLFGGSHQGAFLNVLQGRADVGAFCNACIAHYIEFIKGDFSDPKPGDVIRVTKEAAAPFDQLAGEEVVLVATVPVLNECIAVNTKVLSAAEVAAIQKALTSEATTNNPLIFGDRKDPVTPSFFEKGNMFVTVEDAWYNPVREMSGLPLK